MLAVSFLFHPAARAQQLLKDAGPDSLENALRHAAADTSRAYILQQLSDYWLYKDSARAMQSSRKIFELAEKSGSDYIRGIGHYQTGGVYMVYLQLDSAETHLQQAINLLKKEPLLKAREYLARTWHDYGATCQRRGDIEKFVDILLTRAIPINEEMKDTLRMGINYHDAGLAFMNNDQWEKAAEFYDKAIAQLKYFPRHEILVDAHLSAAANLMYMEDDAPEQLQKISQHLDTAKALLTNNPTSPAWIYYYTCNGLFYQYYQVDPDKALENYDKGLELAESGNEAYRESELVNRKFYLYFDQGNYRLAKKMAYRQYQMALGMAAGHNLRIALRNLIDVEEKLGNTGKAYEYLKRHVALSDSLKENETKVRILELEKRYRTEKKDNEILRLTNESNLRELQLQRSRAWGYLAAGIALLLGLGILAGFKLFRNKQQIARQKEQLHRQEMERLKQEQQQSNLFAMLTGQEQERKRVATDLHDGLGGALSGIRLTLSHIVEESNLDGKFSPVLSQLDNSMTELRRIARNLMPETLLRYGLTTALEEFCRNLENDKTTITFQAYGIEDEKLTQITRVMLYRIVQELVNNAIKHAGPSNILVQLVQHDDKINLTVEDDGLGFDPVSANGKQGIGLSSVKGRVDYLNGRLELLSEPGTGTTVNIDIG